MKSTDFIIARPICSAISNFGGRAFFVFTQISQLPRRLFGFRFGILCCIINSSRTEGETPKEGRKERGALRRKRVIICSPPAAAASAAAGTPVLRSFGPRFSGRGRGRPSQIFPHGDILLLIRGG